MTEDKKNRLKNIKENTKKQKSKILMFLHRIKMSGKTLKFGDVEVNKKEFHASKQLFALNLVDKDKIVISDKFKYSENCSKYFNDYKDDIIRPLCIVLSQMSRYIKYFDNSGKNMSFLFKIEHDTILGKYNYIWNKLKRH